MSQNRCPSSACPRTAVPVPHVPEPRVPIPAICILLPLQLEVLKGEPKTLEEAYNSATKFEAYEQSLVKQGTLDRPLTCIGTSDDDRPKRRARAVNAVNDGEDDEVMDQRRVDHLQNLLEQATKGIVAMAAKKGAIGREQIRS